MILTFTLMTTTAVSLPLKADEAQCKRVLHDCDAALQAEQKVNALDQQIIKDQDQRFSDQATEIRREEFWRPVAIGGFVVSVSLMTLLLLKK